ncbi:polysaccharide biosynthesis/export family protein [Fulvimarina sp. 2208YS6-2-32]|uniref:Polysaccharide biosynthesis/export family protein n=1 Tax=Fulvimarina uroteuthidis TaxID=3098149 RepID=A0ABU5I3V6_9HYPH|nr:polysaccharide biosynthesis/export family protein [Fulvimarina sp. 2208YS6-2-32]MDY8109638.1 polysaccharide biosynthesis/export family protein [Fulvimarina sp. 2208YS6-2-32]
MKTFSRLVIGLSLSVLAGCSSHYKPAPPAFHAALNQPYRFDSGDVARVTVFDQSELTAAYPVDKAGYLSMPLIGDVPARGRTSKQLEGEIAARLRDGFVNDPDVTIAVDRYRPFFIMGEVTQGGQYTYVPGMTVQKAIAVSGGFTPRAEQATVDITRQIGNEIVTGRVLTSDPLLPGDTVYVRERWF